MPGFINFLAVIISFSVLIIIHELGHFWAAKKMGVLVEEFGLGYPPRIFGKKIGETVYSLNWIPFGGFVKIYGFSHLGERPEIQITRSFSHQNIYKRVLTALAGILMNIFLGWFLISAVFLVGEPQLILIEEVKTDSLAATAGLQKNDTFSDFKEIKQLTDFLDTNKGKQIVLNVKRGDKNLLIKVTPRLKVPEGEGNLGILLIETGSPKLGLVKSVTEGFLTTFKTIGLIFVGLGNLAVRLFSGGEVLSNLTGPVGIVDIGIKAVSFGFINLLRFLALLSLNLAVFNFLPIPLLDGGWSIFMIIENFRKKSFTPKTMAIINTLGFSFFVLLALAVTVKDLVNLF
ncbi:MAG: regulator of sigma E protease [Parcubacteria group bacterium Athens0714_26]|nr:MAG: regulator of sigma E protease [Parcubacteria group bacterium Athens1014_26]TSD03547.1 MAG: regulator of sigma E protease [Parcubacteria group bacterium Athens0714_26]